MTHPDQLITSGELAQAAGLTFRQVDYWTRHGAIEPAEDPGGKGARRRYHRNLIEPLRTVSSLDRTFSAGIPTELVAAIVDHHHAGHVDLADGLRLSWRAERPFLPQLARQWTGPVYLTDEQCDEQLAELEQQHRRHLEEIVYLTDEQCDEQLAEEIR